MSDGGHREYNRAEIAHLATMLFAANKYSVISEAVAAARFIVEEAERQNPRLPAQPPTMAPLRRERSE